MIYAYRFCRLILHVMYACFSAGILFKLISKEKKEKLIQRYSKKLLDILNIKLSITADPNLPYPDSLIVANHISWVDIFVLNAVCPVRFISKDEVRNWPLMGWLAEKSGTFFISREKRTDIVRLNKIIASALAQGERVAFFPEGTTTDGTKLKSFNTSLLEPIIQAHGKIQPAAIRYHNSGGEISTAIPYIDEMSLVESLFKILRQSVTIAEITFAEPIPAGNKSRRELGSISEKTIADILSLPIPYRQSGKFVYLLDEHKIDLPPIHTHYPMPKDFSELEAPALTSDQQ